ncbi:MAG: PilZ domain-containing protein [Bryobacteraceae bacterium]
MDAIIRGVDTGFFEVLSPIHLHQDQKLEVLYQGRRLKSTVIYCKKETSGAYDVKIKLALDGDGRSEPRTAVNLRTILNISGSLTPIGVRVVDFSALGLGLELPKRIPVGSTVSVDVGYGVVVGEIRHCAPHVSQYRAGIRLQQFIRRNVLKGSMPVSPGLPGNLAAFGAFVRAIEGRQSRYVAILFSLANSRSRS